MKKYVNLDEAAIEEICKRPVIDHLELIDSVKSICEEVRRNGDRALFRFTRDFDKADLNLLKVLPDELGSAHISLELKRAIDVSITNIRKFHENQIQDSPSIETFPGILCFRKQIPIEKVGLYIPGGSAPLISTLLMLAVPAQIAGCKEIVICTPPSSNGSIHPAILYIANLLGLCDVFKVGGAQAIAAMAFGTETVPQVYKIFGPGNQYVSTAKSYVSLMGTAIDLPAGPSELAVIGDEFANPSWIAADLLSQAEHGVDSQVLFVTTSEKLLEEVGQRIESQLRDLPRASLAKESLSNSSSVLVKDIDTAFELVNRYAPEHLILSLAESEKYIGRIENAGSVFLGRYTPESLGDYSSGTNHVLPTNGAAKAFSGVSLESYLKKITFQSATQSGLEKIGTHVVTLARAEGLEAHAQAVLRRFE